MLVLLLLLLFLLMLLRWTTNTSDFVLRRMSQVIESGARANNAFKEKEVN
jgi:hypothetical protein